MELLCAFVCKACYLDPGSLISCCSYELTRPLFSAITGTKSFHYSWFRITCLRGPLRISLQRLNPTMLRMESTEDHVLTKASYKSRSQRQLCLPIYTQLQTRSNPLTQFIPSLRPFLGTSIGEEGRIMRLVISNDIGSVGEDSLTESAMIKTSILENHTLTFLAKASIGESRISSPPARSKIRSVFASCHHSTGARVGSLQLSPVFPSR